MLTEISNVKVIGVAAAVSPKWDAISELASDDEATLKRFIKKAGAWFEYNGNKIAQGRDAAKLYLKENESVFNELLEKIKNGVVTE